MSDAFDAAFFRRFYESPHTRVQSADSMARLGEALVALIAWYGGTVRSVLEVGAGTGMLRDWFRERHPEVRYVSTDASPHAAKTYGHLCRDIATWRVKRRFDLIVCQGVLPYLGDRDARAAIANIAAMSRGFLYLEAITARDYRAACDKEMTDPAMRRRSAAFYRSALRRHFLPVGAGLFYRKGGPLSFFELETG